MSSGRRDGMRRRILFVAGLEPNARARDVGREFERYGPLVRCDIPLYDGSSHGSSRGGSLYAFVEFEDARDAEEAYEDAHGRRTPVGRLKIEWAKRPPRAHGRDDGPRRRGPSRSRSPARSRSRSRSRSPMRSRSQSRSPSPART